MANHVTEPTIGEAAYRVFLPSEATELDALEKGKVRCVIVTPERAVLDAICEMVVLPMFDGEMGVLAGRAAFVGQLGPGELRLRTGTAAARYYIDGGFVQVRNNTVNVLTAKATPANELTPAKVDEARTQAEALPVTDAITRGNRNKALERVRGMAKVVNKNS